jgi:predicted metal-binding membrane protein
MKLPRTSSLALPVMCLCGCAGARFHSPAVDVLGSYFPAWMVCIMIGLALTLISRLLLDSIGIEAQLRPAPVVYTCLMVAFTMAVWLVFFQN